MRKGKRNRRVIITSFIVAILIITLIPMYLLNQNESNNDTLTESDTEEKAKKEQAIEEKENEVPNTEENENTDSSIDTNTKSNQNTDKNEEPKEDKLNETSQEELKNYVTKPITDGTMIIYGAVPDEQGQNIIPISFIVSSDKPISDYYNQMDQLLLDAGIDLSNYLLKDINYSIDREKQQVKLEVPNDFSLSSSTETYLFESMLKKMFIPLDIYHITFSAKEGINLGPIGTVNELPLQVSKENYKIYDNQYLIPTPLDEGMSLDEAISDMKISDRDFNLSATIPNDIRFSSKAVDNELVLSIENSLEKHSIQELLTMVEAILMTAKSFGFDSVKFENMSIQQIGNYDLNNPIKVPNGVNPIVLK